MFSPVEAVGAMTLNAVCHVGDFALFSGRSLRGLCSRWPRSSVLWSSMYHVGVQSVPVILVTGLFIGMVLAVQSYDTLKVMHFESRIGSVINVSLVKELGPVLAATMLAGRIGSAIAAEIGTMKISEQIDALRALGADPYSYLVAPRLLACFLLIPALTILADCLGMFGGWAVSVYVFGVSSHHYWVYSDQFITAYDFVTGVMKSTCFGAAIALVACHCGFDASAGAEGVGHASTRAFVRSFIAILALDFLLGILTIRLYWLMFTFAPKMA